MKNLGKKAEKFPIFIMSVMWMFCAFQPSWLNKDRVNYIDILKLVQQGGLKFSFFVLEPFFALLSSFLSVILSGDLYYYGFFFFVSGFSLLVKLHIAKLYGVNLCVYLIVFFSYFYFLHEVTQIRIGVGIGFFYISMFYMISGNYRLYFIFGIISSLCHYSCVLFVLMPLLISKKFDCFFIIKFFIFSFLSLLMFYFGNNVFVFLDFIAKNFGIDKISDNVDLIQSMDNGKSSAILRIVPHLPLMFLLLLYFDKIRIDKYAFSLFQCYMIFFLVVIAFSDLYIIAFRVGDLFLFSYVILFSYVYRLIRYKSMFFSILIPVSFVILINVIRSVFN